MRVLWPRGFFVLIAISMGVTARASYYDSEPCSRYKIFDDPVTVFPWEDKPIMGCGWSIGAIQDFKIFGRLPLAENVEKAVSEKINGYRQYQVNFATTLKCCADAVAADSAKAAKPVCINDKAVANFCGDSRPGSPGFATYLSDFNDRLKALRIATARMTQDAKALLASKRPIETPKPVLFSLLGSDASELISLARMPAAIDGLTAEEAAIAETRLHWRSVDFPYAGFITKDATNDYFTLLGSAPFLGEVRESKLTPLRLSQLLGDYIARNESKLGKPVDISYRDFQGFVANTLSVMPNGESQRQMCRYAEYRLKMESAGIAVVKAGILGLAAIKGASRGASVAKGGSIPALIKGTVAGIGEVSTTAGWLVAGVDILRSRELDQYCSTKLFDVEVEKEVPLCDQAKVLKTLDDAQTSAVVGSALSGGAMAFRYLSLLKSKLSKP